MGLHTDEDVQERRGPHLPIMNLHERSLSVLACKYVDEVVIGSPTIITRDLLTTFNISLVVRGSVSETSVAKDKDPVRKRAACAAAWAESAGAGAMTLPDTAEQPVAAWKGRVQRRVASSCILTTALPYRCSALLLQARYAVPAALGILHVLPSADPDMSARNIIQRIVQKREQFEARNAKKVVSEQKYYENKKEYVQEL